MMKTQFLSKLLVLAFCGVGLSHAQLQKQAYEHQDEGDLLVRDISKRIRNGEDLPEALVLGQNKPHELRRSLSQNHFVHRQVKKAGSLTSLRKLALFNFGSNKKLVRRERPPSIFNAQVSSASDQALRTPPQRNCAWQAYITGKQYNVAYPDLQAIYQVLVMLKTTEKNIFRVRGSFPQEGVRYFSLQSNNVDVGFPISTIKDYEIEVDDPENTRNPFAEDSDRPIGTYTINVTPRGDQGLKNELSLCPESMTDRQCRSVNAVMLMRFYTSDPDRPPVSSKTDPPASQPNDRLFGYATPPMVEERRSKSWTDDRSRDRWRVFPTCDQTRSTQVTSLISKHFYGMIPPFAPPVRHNKNNNFVLYLGEDTATAGVYPNLDAAYLLAVAWQLSPELKDKPKKRLMARVTGTLPVTSRNLFTDPKIANYKDADVRYMSFSSIALVSGGPTMDTLDDAAFLRFYEPQQPEGEAWNRSYSFVAAEDPERTCGLYNASQELFLSTVLDGKLQDYWGILDRQLIPKTQRTRLPDRSNGYARLQCADASALDACVDPDYLKNVMEDYYPRIQWYTCDQDGTLEEITDYLGAIPVSETLTNKQKTHNGGVGSN